MASIGIQLSFFWLFVLVLSPQIQAREGKIFSLFTHFRTTYNVKDTQVSLKKAKAASPAPVPAPITAPTPTPAPAPKPASESIPASGPAPEPDFVDRGDGYGLYGSGSSQYSPTKETPATTTFENELLNEDFTGKSYKTGYPKTNFYSNYNNEVYRNNYNNKEYRSNYNNGYNKNYVDSYSNNYHDQYSNNYNGNGYNNYNNNGYERKREGMSDTRFVENGKYYYHVKTANENYNLNGYESGRGRTENEGYSEKSQYPNEFDTMEEYEKQQASQGYTP